MYIVSKDVFDKLSPDAQGVIETEGKSVSDAEKMKQIDALTAENDVNNMDMPESDMQDMKFGDEDEYSAQLDSSGKMADLPESERNKFKSFDESHEAGNALIKKLSETGLPKKKEKVEKIPEKEEEE